jgi:hemolysin D
MVIVPNEGGVEVEAMVLNQDIGWVRGQQPAAVKVEAFPFTRYGTLDAQVVDVNDDAITNEQLGLVYAARVKLSQSRMRIDGKWIELSPGMAVTVEIKTGSRRLIEYFLSPVTKATTESIRER